MLLLLLETKHHTLNKRQNTPVSAVHGRKTAYISCQSILYDTCHSDLIVELIETFLMVCFMWGWGQNRPRYGKSTVTQWASFPEICPRLLGAGSPRLSWPRTTSTHCNWWNSTPRTCCAAGTSSAGLAPSMWEIQKSAVINSYMATWTPSQCRAWRLDSYSMWYVINK